MNCLRCNREIDTQQEFCSTCLQSMEQYPVNPDTPIQLPHPRAAEKPAAKKRALSPEEQLAQMRKLLRGLLAGAALLLILLCLVTALLVKEYRETPPQQMPMGRNYSVTTQQTE